MTPPGYSQDVLYCQNKDVISSLECVLLLHAKSAILKIWMPHVAWAISRFGISDAGTEARIAGKNGRVDYGDHIRNTVIEQVFVVADNEESNCNDGEKISKETTVDCSGKIQGESDDIEHDGIAGYNIGKNENNDLFEIKAKKIQSEFHLGFG